MSASPLSPTPRRRFVRAAVLLLGALAVLAGAAWSATAAGLVGGTGDSSASGETAAATTPDPDVKLTADGLIAWLDAVGALETAAPVAEGVVENAPFGAKRFFQAESGKGFEFVPWAKAKITEVVGTEGIDLSTLDARLDDIDGDGDETSDFHEIDGVTVDLDVDLTPREAAGAFDARVRLDVKVASASPLAMTLDGLKINGKDAADALEVDLATTLRLDPNAAKKVTIPANAGPLGTLRLGVDGTYQDADSPLAFRVGILGVRAAGTVQAEAGVQLTLTDPNDDGVIDLSELAAPASLIDVSCVSSGADVDLTVTADLAGLSGKVGRLTLDDTSLCNGLAAPEIELGDLAQFRNLTLGDLVNGLAQVTQAVKSAQAAGDLQLPFVQEPLRDLVSVNERLVQFFVDNGFTDPASPMSSISVDTADDAAITTLQDLAPKLAAALGMPEDSLQLRYENGAVRLRVATSSDAGAMTGAGTIDFGDALRSVGITDVTGSAAATIDPAYSVDLGVGFDLAPGKALDQRFFLTNGAAGTIATLDAGVTADLDVSAVASVLGVRLRDANDDGAVTLLERKDSAKPMLSVALTDPDKDGRTTLAEMSAAAALPVRATVNATVPSTQLRADADVAGVPLAAGTVTLAWPTVPETSAAEGLSVTADGDFLANVLPFSYDADDPRALISQVLTVTRETLTRVRSAVADGNGTTTRPLPLVGKSVADLDPVLGKVQDALDELIRANDITTLTGLQDTVNQALAQELGTDPAAPTPELVDLTYEPATADQPASLLVQLALGACSTDRAEGRTGCTVTGAPVSVPFNLSLGTGSTVGGVAGIGADGTVEVGYDARANLTFGVQLPTVGAGATPSDLPTVTGAPKLFVQDDSSLHLGVGAQLDGVLSAGLGPVQVSLGKAGEEGPAARAAVAARFRLADPDPSGDRFVVGSGAFTTWLTGLLPEAGSVTVHETDDALAATCPDVTDAVDACAALPVYVGETSLGTVTFAAPDLLTPSGWTVESSQVEANLKNEAIQFSLLVDGVRTLTRQVADGLRSLPTGTRIPLVGTDVTAGADVLKAFDDSVLSRVQTLSTTVASAGTAGAVKTKAEEVLADTPGLKPGATPTVTVTCRAETDGTVAVCTGTEPIARLQSLEVGLPLAYSVTKGTGPFDLGFPGLRLASDGSVTGSAGLEVNLGFGIDRDLGFYVPTTASTKEFAVTARADLPDKLTGDLAFLPVEITDRNATDDVTVSAGVDLTTSRPDGRLPLVELGQARLTPTLNARADIDLGLRTLRPAGALSALPTLAADLDLDAGVTWSGAAGAKPTTNASIAFRNVTVDAGSLVSDVIKPATRTLHTYTEPLEKPIEAIRKPIPGVAEAARMAGRTAPSWYDAFKTADAAANGGTTSSGVQMIDRVIMLTELVKALDNPDVPAGQIPVGSFTVLPSVADQPVPLADADSMIGTSSVATPNIISKLQFTGSDKLAEATAKGGFTFPAFEKPSSLFGMLLGKDVPLVYFDAGKLSVERGFQFSYPIGPARLYIGGSAGVSGHLAAGFDTYGVRKAFEVLNDDDPTNNGAWSLTKGLLQGLYLDDFDQSGKDVPEIRFDASLSAGASVGVPGLEAGAEGGVEGTAEFNLRTDSTGKLRYTDIAQQLKINKNPLCFFDASARIDAYIKAYVDSPFGKADYPIVSKRIYDQPNLFEFCSTPQSDEQENLLAELGPDGALVFKTDAAPQSITVTQTGAHTVDVAAQGIVETYDGVASLVADLQAGDDVMDVRYAVASADVPALPVTICGGAGNDRIMVDRGAATVYGDGGPGCAGAGAGGDDSITTGPGDDTVDGGGGADSIDTGDGDDTLSGGAGDDVLRGGRGDDTIDGGDGDDTTDYTDHTEPVTISLPGPSGQAGESDTATNVESVYGGTADDTITLPGGHDVRADGGGGDDTIVTATGTALVMGGPGNDTFVGGRGAGQFVGSAGDDVLVDGPGAQTFLGMEGQDTVDYSAVTGPVRVVIDGEPGDGPLTSPTDNIVDADVVIGTASDDQLTGGSGSEELRGGPGDDILEGGPGADRLLGQAGHDTLVGNSGADTLFGGAGDDDLDGGTGDDRLDGGADDDRLYGGEGGDDLVGGDGFDWVDYSDRTEDLRVTKDNVAYDGAGFGAERDNLHTDVEKYVGGSGRDEVTGWSGDEVFVGNGGDDYIQGMGGSDVFDGGAGNDLMYDKDANHRFDADEGAVDTFVGGPGNDSAYGNGGEDLYDMGSGDDFVDAGPQADTIRCGDGDDQVYADAGDDHVLGGAGDDSIHGDAGDDLLEAGDSDQGSGTIWGGLGADTIYNGTNGGNVVTGTGGTETDTSTNVVYGFGGPADRYSTYTGALGKDIFHLGSGNDIVHAGGGDDIVELGDGNNTADGGDGNDTITGGDGKDQINGGNGDDVLVGGAGRDNLYGEAGNDVLDGGADDDGLWGYEGDDVLVGGPNSDVINGGPGLDTVSYADRTTPVVLKEDGNYGEGGVEDVSSQPGSSLRDIVDSSVEHYIGGQADDRISLGKSSRTLPVVLEGGPGDDELVVRSTATVAATFVGGPGDDVLTGGGGADTFLQGDAPDGADDITGGAGVDTVDYSGRPTGSARVTFDGVADDGAPGEGDNVHADVEHAPGAQIGADPQPVFTLEPVEVTEGAAGTTSAARFTVHLDQARGTDLTVPWTVVGVTATAGQDFTAGGGTVTVPAGATSATFDVPVLGDALDEVDETATVTVGTPPGSTAQATLTIADDDPAPRVTVRPVAVKEGDRGTRAMTFRVVLSAASGKTVTVQVATENGTAKAGSDYTAKRQKLTFAPGRTSLTFTVSVIGDKRKERNETLKVALSAPENATVGTPATGTIRDDD